MLIPSIDLMGGRVVQLEQGSRLAFETDDLDGWLRRFAPFPLVQVIDLDAALGKGDNHALVRSICRQRPCQVGGGVRTADQASRHLADGAARVIVGSAFFNSTGVALDAAHAFAECIAADVLVAAVDSRAGQVVIHGWRTAIPVTAADAVRALEPFVGGFLYTHVDTEGLLLGADFSAVAAVRAATSRRVIAAGGIRSTDEIARLDRMGVDAVVGMAVYRGLIDMRTTSESIQLQDAATD